MHTLILRWRDPRAGMFFLETTCAGGAHLIVSLDDVRRGVGRQVLVDARRAVPDLLTPARVAVVEVNTPAGRLYRAGKHHYHAASAIADV